MLQIATSSIQQKMMPMIKETLAAAGIDMKIQNVEWSVYLQRLEEQNFEACCLGWQSRSIRTRTRSGTRARRTSGAAATTSASRMPKRTASSRNCAKRSTSKNGSSSPPVLPDSARGAAVYLPVRAVQPGGAFGPLPQCAGISGRHSGFDHVGAGSRTEKSSGLMNLKYNQEEMIS